MNRFVRLSAAATACSLLLASAGAALAQPGAPSTQSQGAGPQQPDLPQLLHLRPDQMGAFHAFQAASQARPGEIAQLRASAPQTLAGVPTPERLERINTFLNLQLQMFHRSADAMRAFYSQLSPDQQKIFDQLTARGPGGQRRPSGS